MGDSYYVPKNQKSLAVNIMIWAAVFFVFIGLLTAAGWRVGWWFQGKAVNYQAHILRHSYANQQTLRDQITAKLGDVQSISVQIITTSGSEKQALVAQRLAVASIVCQDAEQVSGDPLPTDQTAWVGANCSLGTVSPNSTLEGS